MQEHIQRINVIVRRLFEVESVSPHLPRRFTIEDVPSAPLPAFGQLEFGKKSPEKEQRQSLAQKMSIRRKVCGQIGLKVTPVEAQCISPVPAQLRREERRVQQEKIGPDPGQASERNLKAARPVHSHWVRISLVP